MIIFHMHNLKIFVHYSGYLHHNIPMPFSLLQNAGFMFVLKFIPYTAMYVF